MVSVICPVLNEASFIRAWANNVMKFADEVIVLDMGSTDGTLDILRPFHFKVYGTSDTFEPYGWPEAELRNTMINMCKGNWIVNLDADELMGDEFIDALHDLRKSKRHFHRLAQYPFWYSPNTMRVAQWNGGQQSWRRFPPRGMQIRMFRNCEAVRYAGEGNHAHLEYRGLGKVSPRLSEEVHKDIPFYYYHWAVGLKPGDNRADEWKKSGIRLETYFGKHPAETTYYPWWEER